MLRCVLAKVAAATAVAVGGVGAAAYYETNGEILSYVTSGDGHTCPLSALASSGCGESSSCCSAAKSGCCLASEDVAETNFDVVAATVGGMAYAAAPAPGCEAKPALPVTAPEAVSDAAQPPQ